jgi:hypothetical protein
LCTAQDKRLFGGMNVRRSCDRMPDQFSTTQPSLGELAVSRLKKERNNAPVH